jgi:hypothetical protein
VAALFACQLFCNTSGHEILCDFINISYLDASVNERYQKQEQSVAPFSCL